MDFRTSEHELLNVEPPAAPRPRDRLIGKILLDAGLIRQEDIDRIVDHARRTNTKFGEAAIALRLVGDRDMASALAYQFDYPIVVKGTSQISGEVVAAFENSHPILSDLHNLRNQLLLRWISADGAANKTLAIMSPGQGEGRTFLAANLAVTLSQMGQRTLLIDADFRQPRMHNLFGVENHAGLSALLAERSTRGALQRVQGLRDLTILPCGGIPPNPTDLLSKPFLGDLLGRLAGSFDIIILDTPAADLGPEAQMIAARAKGCVVVAREGVSRMRSLQVLARNLASTGTTVIGTVLVKA